MCRSIGSNKSRAPSKPSSETQLVGTMSKAMVVASMGAVAYGTLQLGTAFVPAAHGRAAEDGRSALRGAVVEQAVRHWFSSQRLPQASQGTIP